MVRYTVKRSDGERATHIIFATYDGARKWKWRFCKDGKVVPLVEMKKNPPASRQYYNEMMENFGAYRVNPYVSLG